MILASDVQPPSAANIATIRNDLPILCIIRDRAQALLFNFNVY